ncbi:hypothetical protein UFOVP450_206 [uncultured Caudovirales phage]|uniref:Uncharacterized protein n=1 Tax=uncultured Caudovirales phage TaxID=2100421 RepID=A0A6J5MAE5_9CAUD|nr:hypothetical protein UFOVP450_206 [uncultured Caudovirales phage]
MNKQNFRKLVKEVYQEVLDEEKLKEGLLSWAGGVADNIVYSVINNYKNIRQSDIFKDPKIRSLAKDLKISQSDLENRVSDLLQRDRSFLRALATQRYIRR